MNDLTADSDVQDALLNLTDEQLLKLENTARYRSAVCQRTPHELLNEAIARALEDGRRNWPDDVEIVQFLQGIIRSIAGDDSRLARRSREKPVSDAGTDSPDNEISAERRVALQERLDEIWDLFEDRDDVQKILLGRAEGMQKSEIIEQFDMSDREYCTARKHLRRKLDQHFPEGWSP